MSLIARSRLRGVACLIVALAVLAGCPTTVTQDKSIWSNHVGWSYVGQPGFSPGSVGALTMAFQPSGGGAYVAFEDYSVSRGTLWHLSQGTWVQVGGSFSAGDIDTPNFAFWNGMIFVSFKDNSLAGAGRVSVAYYNGGWGYIGAPGITPNPVNDNTPLVISPSGHGFIAFWDSTASHLGVMDWNGSSWNFFPDFLRGHSISTGGAWQITMNVDPSGIPAVAYSDGTTGNNATEMYYDGSNWVTRGAAGFAPFSVWNLHSTVSLSGTQYVVFTQSGASGHNPSVMQFNAGLGTWSLVGPRGIYPADTIGGVVIAVDSQGTPYVAFLDGTNNNRVTVMKFDGTQWNVVGQPGFTNASIDRLTLAIGPGDVPYVAFRDTLNGNKACVMAYQ